MIATWRHKGEAINGGVNYGHLDDELATFFLGRTAIGIARWNLNPMCLGRFTLASVKCAIATNKGLEA
jgi:hypothetical protein